MPRSNQQEKPAALLTPALIALAKRNETPTRRELWAVLPREDRKSAIVLALQEERFPHREVLLKRAAEALNRRPRSIATAPILEIAAGVARSTKLDETTLGELIRGLHLKERIPLMSTFLDALAIPHQEGAIKRTWQETQLPSAALAMAADKIASRFPAVNVVTYLLALRALHGVTFSEVRQWLSDFVSQEQETVDVRAADTRSLAQDLDELESKCEQFESSLPIRAELFRNAAGQALVGNRIAPEIADVVRVQNDELARLHTITSAIIAAIKARSGPIIDTHRPEVQTDQGLDCVRTKIVEARRELEQQEMESAHADALALRLWADAVRDIQKRDNPVLDPIRKAAHALQVSLDTKTSPPDDVMQALIALRDLMGPSSELDDAKTTSLAERVSQGLGAAVLTLALRRRLEARVEQSQTIPDPGGLEPKEPIESPILRTAIPQEDSIPAEIHPPIEYKSPQQEKASKPSLPPPEILGDLQHTLHKTPVTISNRASVVWQLLLSTEPALAVHVHALAIHDDVDVASLPCESVIRCIVISDAIRASDGALADAFRESLSSAALCVGVHQGTRSAQGLMLCAACLVPALIAPATGASQWLRTATFGIGSSHLWQMAQAIADFALDGIPLSIEIIGSVRDRADWELQDASIKEDIREWLTRAPAYRLNYAAATSVWRNWLERGGLIETPLRAISEGRAKISDMESSTAWMYEPASIRQHIDNTDRQILARRRGEPIQSVALNQLISRTAEARSLLARWKELQSLSPTRQLGRRLKQANELRRRIQDMSAVAIHELRGTAETHEDPLLALAATRAVIHVRRLQTLFDVTDDSTAAEGQLQQLLNGPLLRFAEIGISADWEPKAQIDSYTAMRRTFQAAWQPYENSSGDIVSAAALDRMIEENDWEVAVRTRLDARDFTGADLTLTYLSTDTAFSRETLGTLQALRRAAEKDARNRLYDHLGEVRNAIEQAIALGVASDDDRAAQLLRLESVAARHEQTADFVEAEQQLKLIQRQLNDMKMAAVQEVQSRLENTGIVENSDAWMRIASRLDEGDVLTANEFLERASRGMPLDSSAFPPPPSAARFVKFAAELDALLPQVSPKEIEQWLIGATESRLPTLPADRRVDAEAARSIVREWFARRTPASADSALCEAVLGAMGFTGIESETSVKGVHTWTEVRSDTISDRARIPVPYFGSAAKGHYRILWWWDSPKEDAIVNAVRAETADVATLVFVFSGMTIARRRALRERSREQRVRLLVLDDYLLSFLLSQEAPERLPLLFASALPFTHLMPFHTTAGEVPPELFYGRANERASIIAPDGSCFVYGGRQLGKTALLKDVQRTFHDKSVGQMAIYLDLKVAGVGIDRSMDSVWNLLSAELTRVGVLTGVNANAAGPEQIFGAMRTWLERDPQRRVLLLLDEADRFLERDAGERGNAEGEVVGFPRASRLKGWMDQTGRRFKVVFAGLHNVQRTRLAPNHALAHMGEPVCVGPLLSDGEWKSALSLIRNPLAAVGFALSVEHATRILSQTNYYPSLIQLYCTELLRHVTERGIGRFDGIAVPPYDISDQQVQEAYQSQELRERIKHSFDLTLNLDPRYRVIALCIAYASFELLRSSESLGFTADEVRALVLEWWAEGFTKDSSESAIRALLDEMIGLGVLRAIEQSSVSMSHNTLSEARYAIRSSNVNWLVGSQEEIERKLLDLSDQPATVEQYEPSVFRRVFRHGGTHNLRRRSPFTIQQEQELSKPGHGVTIVFGSEAASLSECAVFLAHLTGVHRCVVGAGQSEGDLVAEIKNALTNPREALTLVVVDAQCDWTEAWIHAALRPLLGHRGMKRAVRVVFLAEPQKAWALLSTRAEVLSSLAVLGVARVSLQPWHESVVKQWLEDLGIATNQGSATPIHIRALTGNWPRLVEAYAEEVSGLSPARAAERLTLLTNDFSAQARLRKWDELLGLNLDIPLQILHVLAQLESCTEEELSALSAANQLVTKTALEWADVLRLVLRTGNGLWSLDPIIQRLVVGAEFGNA